MSAVKLSEKDPSEWLATPLDDQPKEDSITLIAIVRKGRQTDSIDVALSETGRWVTLPLSGIESARDLGAVMLGDALHRIMELVIIRPRTDAAFFDLFGFALEQIGTLLSRKAADCASESGGAGPSPIYMQRSSSRGRAAACSSCLIMAGTRACAIAVGPQCFRYLDAY